MAGRQGQVDRSGGRGLQGVLFGGKRDPGSPPTGAGLPALVQPPKKGGDRALAPDAGPPTAPCQQHSAGRGPCLGRTKEGGICQRGRGGYQLLCPLGLWCHKRRDEFLTADGPADGNVDGNSEGNSEGNSNNYSDGGVDGSVDGHANVHINGSANGNVSGSADGSVGRDAGGNVNSTAGGSASATKGGRKVSRGEDKEEVPEREDAEAASTLEKMSRDDYAVGDGDTGRDAGGDTGSDAGPELNATASPFVPMAQARRDVLLSPERAAGQAAVNRLGKDARATANDNETFPDPPSLARLPNPNLVYGFEGEKCCPPARYPQHALRQRLQRREQQ